LWISLAFLASLAPARRHRCSINTILQTLADRISGARVISMYVMCFLGFAPDRQLHRGALAEVIGVSLDSLGCGITVVLQDALA